MMVQGFSTSFFVADPMRSARFYVDCFDFSVTFGNETERRSP